MLPLELRRLWGAREVLNGCAEWMKYRKNVIVEVDPGGSRTQTVSKPLEKSKTFPVCIRLRTSKFSLVQLPVLMNDWATCAKSRNCSFRFLPNNGYSLRLLCRLTPPPVQSIINMLRFLVGFAVVGATSSESTLSAWPQLFLVFTSSAVPSVSQSFLQPLTVPS